ncbi:MAG: ExbD/TolR family protein [Phycisphaerales bacterium]
MLIGGNGRDQLESATVELTPIIDMVFLLLIFFLVATTFHQTEREMQIALPQTVSGGPISMSLRDLVVNVTEEGDLIVSGRRLEENALAALIEEAVAANPEQKVTIRGDEAVSYGVMARVLDLCKTAGIQEPYLDTIPLR